MNIVRAGLDDGALVVGDQRLELPHGLIDRRSGLAAYRGRDVALGIRPEHLLDPVAAPQQPRLRCEVRFSEALPPERLVHATVAAQPVLTDAMLEIAKDVDEAAVERLEELAEEHTVPLCARFDISTDVQRGSYELAVAVDKVHFFDLQTGLAIR